MQQARLAEDAWNTRDPANLALGILDRFTLEAPLGVHERTKGNQCFPRSQKWATELDYGLNKELWAIAGNRIAVRFTYEWYASDHWIALQIVASLSAF
jgi:uncharacterized protein